MLASVLAPLLVLAGAVPALAQQSEGLMSILPIDVSSVASDVTALPSSEEGIMSILPISTESDGIMSIMSTTEGIMSILPISTSTLTDTGVMSIPPGETPLATTSERGSGVSFTTQTSTAEETPSASETSAASAVHGSGQGVPLLLATCSALSMAFGFAWLLL